MANPPDGSPAQIAQVRMEQTMKQRLPQMILAPTNQFESLWASYVTEMNAAGIPAYEAYYQQALNQRLRAWNIVR
jgi:putative aldouronate transport system substrate-binding protein